MSSTTDAADLSVLFSDIITSGFFLKLYMQLSGETFLKKGSPPNPLPKTFNTNLSLLRRTPYKKEILRISGAP